MTSGPSSDEYRCQNVSRKVAWKGMKTLHFDCLSGISGDMTVGALRDLGVEECVFLEALEGLGLQDEMHAHFHRDGRQQITGWRFHVHSHHEEHEHTHDREPAHHHHHGGEHHHHGHDAHSHTHGRTHAEIRTLISGSRLPEQVKARVLAVFQRIAIAEGRIHGVPPEEVGFHEVGAIDSIADIVCACAGLAALEVNRITASVPFEGTGTVRCAHGLFPLPSPATLEILTGLPLRQIDEPHEFITPTGAAILAEFATAFGPLPETNVSRIGYGIGTRDTPQRPNVLRLILGESEDSPSLDTDEIIKIESNLDDLSPEIAGAVMERLLKAGALDVFHTPAQMKKNRPGFLLTVISPSNLADGLAEIILRETSAFGVRLQPMRRLKLHREVRDVATPYGPVSIKFGYLGDEIVQAAPEYDSCRHAAERSGASVREVFLAASAAARQG